MGLSSFYLAAQVPDIPLALVVGVVTGLILLLISYGTFKGYSWGYYGGVGSLAALALLGLIIVPGMAPEGLLLLMISTPTLIYMLWSRQEGEREVKREVEEEVPESEEDLLF